MAPPASTKCRFRRFGAGSTQKAEDMNNTKVSRRRFARSRTAIALGAAAALFAGGLVASPVAAAQQETINETIDAEWPETYYVYLVASDVEIQLTDADGDGAYKVLSEDEVQPNVGTEYGIYITANAGGPGEDEEALGTLTPVAGETVQVLVNEYEGNGEEGEPSSLDELSSNFDFTSSVNADEEEQGPSDRCIGTGLAVGLPLLLLIPAGLASQLGLAGSSALAAPINSAIQDANTEIQRQIGLLDPNAAQAVESLNEMLAPFGVTAGQAAIGVGMVAAGVAGTAAILDACSTGGSSLTGLGWFQGGTEDDAEAGVEAAAVAENAGSSF